MDQQPGMMGRLEGYHRQIRDTLVEWFDSEEGSTYRHRRLLAMVPDLFRLLVRLLADERVPTRYRAPLVAAVVSVVSPADFLPETLLGPVGYEDDLLIMALCVFRVLEGLPSHVVLENWDGDDNLLKAIPVILEAGEDMVGSGLWRRLREWVGEF